MTLGWLRTVLPIVSCVVVILGHRRKTLMGNNLEGITYQYVASAAVVTTAAVGANLKPNTGPGSPIQNRQPYVTGTALTIDSQDPKRLKKSPEPKAASKIRKQAMAAIGGRCRGGYFGGSSCQPENSTSSAAAFYSFSHSCANGTRE